ncbi:primosomal protein N' [Treponema primitia ZAS-2]|uniref:Replication restart protein PriA n=1 Tax=Treponema primitia (strain ATCC BAA-887 / DSM 12427 / ZAS-2) TaxID=545694 RepID=F5YGI2_TREPZ|nr:primosomal protein N' [Treponema primitia]AEF85167.1 primosomal protein N' [Treponema primitia ZAS-2]
MADSAQYLDIVFDVPIRDNPVFTYRMDPKGEAALGKRVMAPFGRREMTGYIIGQRDEAPAALSAGSIKAVRRVVDGEPVFDSGDVELAKWMAGYYLCGLGEALAAMIPSGRRVGGYSSFDDDEDIAQAALSLSEEQEKALAAITAPAEKPPPFYLYGITGSGKTEVFLRAAESAIREGKSVIYLVPEISLTHQTAEAIGKRFGPVAATIHSGMSPSKRLTEWVRIRAGEVHIVVGPRSAVFAPVKNLGLIIIDEEHDGSYKSGNTPRYHARQVAMRRVATSGARLVMGSATPSAEAWKLMKDGGIKRLDLTRRLSGGSPPEIIPVSLEHTEGCLTGELKDEIRKTAQLGRQSILFLNRRGFAYFYHCKQCGFELSCKHCSVSLTYHKSKGRAVCHYCGYSVVPPKACPECGSLEAGFAGFGTEMIEEEVARTFPELRLRRADADTTGRKGSLAETLDIFKAGGMDILLGTQMVAKGLNFPGVRLVGVVLADTGLHMPDFRAAERTFSLIVQVAGRAGRYFPDGKVIVQTLRPHDPAITRACALDVEGFFTAELAQREMLGFPPYTRLIRFTLRSKEAERADGAIARLASIATPLIPRDADVLGPAECPIGIMSGNHRRQLILRGKTMGTLHTAARAILDRYDKGRDAKAYLEVDVDPVSLL